MLLLLAKLLKTRSSFELSSNEERRDGLSLNLTLKCTSCLNAISFNTSKKIEKGAFKVNQRSVLAVNALKGGRQTLASFCCIMNMPPPVTCKAYNIHLKTSAKAVVNEAEELMVDAANRLCKLMLERDPTFVDGDEDNAIPSERYPIKKEECLGHIQKRIGNALHNLVHDMKGKRLADGKSVGGKGCLTQDKTDSFQRYYGQAIRDHAQKSIEDTKNAIWAIYHHSVSNPKVPLEKQHKLCPMTRIHGVSLSQMVLMVQIIILIQQGCHLYF